MYVYTFLTSRTTPFAVQMSMVFHRNLLSIKGGKLESFNLHKMNALVVKELLGSYVKT